jgi:single-stranded-DNA-specific exonuclease
LASRPCSSAPHPARSAGFSIDPERIPEFRAAFSRAVAASAEIIPEPALAIDAYVELPDLTLDLVAEISRLAPFGPGNPALTLAVRDVRIASHAAIGRTGEHRRLTVEDARDRTQTVFWWQGADRTLPRGVFDLALTVRASDYRGLAEVQVEWIDARQQEPDAVEIEPVPTTEIRDYRDVSNPETVLRGLVARGDVQVWAEGRLPAAIEVRTRRELGPCPRLAVWTPPPGPRQWQAALARAQPDEIILFAQDPGLDERGPFLQELAGLVKFALRARQGQVDIEKAASRLGHRASTIAAGLRHLEATAVLGIVERGDDHWHVEAGTGQPDAEEGEIMGAQLDALLAETSAYRQYFLHAPARALARSDSMG